MYWDGPNCTGTAYGTTNLNVFSCYSDKFCIGDKPVVTLLAEIKSMSYTAGAEDCRDVSLSPPGQKFFTIKEVQLPFSVPVAVPMRIEILP
jgi:hypothetical protein